MIGEHTVKSQRPRSVHDTKALKEQAESAKFMAQTGNEIVMFLYFILLTKLNLFHHACSLLYCTFQVEMFCILIFSFPFSNATYKIKDNKFPISSWVFTLNLEPNFL